MGDKRLTALIPFTASNGAEYELRVLYDPSHLTNPPSALREGEMGEIMSIGPAIEHVQWESLSEMTHRLKMEIVSWSSDAGN